MITFLWWLGWLVIGTLTTIHLWRTGQMGDTPQRWFFLICLLAWPIVWVIGTAAWFSRPLPTYESWCEGWRERRGQSNEVTPL